MDPVLQLGPYFLFSGIVSFAAPILLMSRAIMEWFSRGVDDTKQLQEAGLGQERWGPPLTPFSAA